MSQVMSRIEASRHAESIINGLVKGLIETGLPLAAIIWGLHAQLRVSMSELIELTVKQHGERGRQDVVAAMQELVQAIEREVERANLGSMTTQSARSN